MNTIDYKHFYAELGKLLYALADVDKVITPKEKQLIYELLRKELVPAEKHRDEFGTDVAYYASFEIDILDDQVADGETALQSFIGFIDTHRTLIDQRMRNTCLLLANQLAAAYYGTNKKEQQLLDTLKKKLQAV